MIIEIKVPALAESVADATLLDWQKKPGDFVKRGDHLIDLETDKVTLEINAQNDGLLKALLKQTGEIVVTGDLLATIETDAQEVEPQTDQSTSIEILDEKAPSTGPAARKMISEKGLDLRNIKSSSSSNRINKKDVQAHVKDHSTQINTDVPAANHTGNSPDISLRQERREPMSRLRLRATERLLAAQHDNAILTTFNEVNLSSVKQLRAKLQPDFEKKYGYRLGFMPFFVQATINALREFPLLNASIDDQEIVYHDYFDIGIAVSSPRGLVVPVIRDVDQLGFAEIEAKIRNLGERSRNSTLTIEDLTGGTFTITNGGTFGSMLSTPIINPPQSAILGMHAIQDRPVAENNQVVIRPVMYLALSYDHRIIDGREAVSFLVTIKKQLEDPALLFLGEI